MQRYLLNIAYIGTKYKGVTKNVNLKDHVSVEDVLKQGLQSIKQIKSLEIYPSSRTDAGVHATNTTVHIDLDRFIKPELITKKVNATLQAWHEDIRILKTMPVKNDFDSRRFATCRTYLYRFAVAKDKVPQGISPKLYKHIMFIPIEESFRCFFVINENFNIDKMKEAAKQMEGYHDFRSFMRVSKEQKTFHPRFCYRNMKSIDIRPGLTLATSFNREKTLAHYDFYDIEFKCRAYFYRQIRNMVGTLIGVGNNQLSNRDVYEFLTIPSKRHRILEAPSSGLYLINVEYPDEVLKSYQIENIDKDNRGDKEHSTNEDALVDREESDDEEKSKCV